MSSIYVSSDGLRLLQDDLARARAEYDKFCEERTRAVELTGDGWHDNPYLNHLQQREAALNHEIARLQGLLGMAVVLSGTPHPRPCARVAIGSIVTCVVTDNRTSKESRQTWEIVGFGETRRECQRLAYNAPLGAFLVGRSPGDLVEATLPAGPADIEIIALHGDWTEARAAHESAVADRPGELVAI